MVLGIVAVAGGVLCWLPLLISPVAWVMGAKAVAGDRRRAAARRPAAARPRPARSSGIIGTVLLVLRSLLGVLLVVLSLTIDDFWSEDNWSDDSWDQASALLQRVRAG